MFLVERELSLCSSLELRVAIAVSSSECFRFLVADPEDGTGVDFEAEEVGARVELDEIRFGVNLELDLEVDLDAWVFESDLDLDLDLDIDFDFDFDFDFELAFESAFDLDLDLDFTL